MKVNLFNDKQVGTIFRSVYPKFEKLFYKAEGEIEALLGDGSKSQLESNTEIAEYRKSRQETLDTLLKLVDLNKQIEKVNKDYEIATKHYSHRNRLSSFVNNVEQATIDFNKQTEENCENKASLAAREVLGIDDIDYRLEAMRNDIKARLATMAVSDYDSVVSMLESEIKIKDYFVTL